MKNSARAEASLPELCGRSVTFRLDNEAYCIDFLDTRQATDDTALWSAAQGPGLLRGVVHRHGKVLALVDMRLRFLLDAQDEPSGPCIIAEQVRGAQAPVTRGVLVDDTHEAIYTRLTDWAARHHAASTAEG